MSPIKEFTTAAKRVKAEADEEAPAGFVEFSLDGETMTAALPDEGQWAMLMAEMTDYAELPTKVAASINFVFNCLDEQSSRHIKRRLMDRHDEFGQDEILDIVDYLVEQWTGNPTGSPSASTPSRPRAGKRSTASRRHPGKTPSASPQTASAT